VLTTTLTTFFAALDDSPLAAASRRAIRADLRQFAVWWEQARIRPFDPTLLVNRDFRTWQIVRQQQDGVKPSTINRALASLRRFCAWAVAAGLLPENPTSGITDVPAEAQAPRSLPDAAVDALLRAVLSESNTVIRARDEALLALLIYAGLRAQEACDVQVRDLDLQGASVTVRRGKGGKARRVPLHADAVRILDQYLRGVRCPAGVPAVGSTTEREPFLVGIDVTAPGQPWRPGITTALVRHQVKLRGQHAAATLRAAVPRERNLLRAATLTDLARILDTVSPHTLRHSLARRLLRTGAQLPEVQRILGHTRLTTTGIYLTPSDDDLRDAIGRAGV
jgi:integrase/recombinase XerC